MDQRLFVLQRLSAVILGPLVLVHLGLILHAVRGGLSAQEILARTQGNGWWMAFYGLFVVAAAVHAGIGVRNVLLEWLRLPRRLGGALGLLLGAALLVLGARAVVAVGGAWA